MSDDVKEKLSKDQMRERWHELYREMSALSKEYGEKLTFESGHPVKHNIMSDKEICFCPKTPEQWLYDPCVRGAAPIRLTPACVDIAGKPLGRPHGVPIKNKLETFAK